MIGKKRVCVAILALVSSLGSAARAHAWTVAYGEPYSLDQGQRRVAPVVGCAGGGYIAVGSHGLGDSADPDVYVVRTDAAGDRLWEGLYDVQSSGLINEGMAIAEDPAGGWVVLSNTLDGAWWYTALTRIDCSGNHLWTQAYRDTEGDHVWGRDLIRTESGDYAVAGISGHHGLDEDGFMMRTRANGDLLWNFSYHGGGQEAFHALAEAVKTSDQSAGDLVAVGRFNRIGEDLDGFMVRVSGETGRFPLDHCMAVHGDTGTSEVYNSITRLAAPGVAGRFAIVGTAGIGTGREDIWVMTSSGCRIYSESRIRDAATDELFYASEQGYDIREVRAGSVEVPAGTLAIAGSYQPFGGGTEALLVYVARATLQPLYGELYGDLDPASPRTDLFRSLAEDPAGGNLPRPSFILAGFTESSGGGDPQDLYLVHTDPSLPTCRAEWLATRQRSGIPFKTVHERQAPEVEAERIRTRADLRQSSLTRMCPAP